MSLLSIFKTRQPVIYILAICFAIPLIAMLFPGIPGVDSATSTLTSWNTIIMGFTFIPATLSLIIRNVKSVTTQKKGWIYEAWTLVVMVITFGVYFATQSITSVEYTFLFDAIYASSKPAVWGIIAMYMLIVPTYGFRLRNIEVAVFTIACCLVALMNAPIGAAIWSGFPAIGSWLVDWPYRGINYLISTLASLGALLMALRIIRGRERGLLG